VRTIMRAAVLSAVVALAVVVSGCADDGSTAQPTGEPMTFNKADVDFVQMMIPHHQQAVMMSAMAEQAASNPWVVDLAAEIEAAQQPEIDLMRSWLDEWEVEEADAAGHMAMGHGADGSGMPGMMTAEALDALSDADGSRFDVMFLTMMIEHHEGAVEMAETVIEDGMDPRVEDLAEDIIDAQTREITAMQERLDA
jgi:uncharacterized protein (DUF305 family)